MTTARTEGHVLDPETLGGHADRLLRVAHGLCRSREDAEDLVQDTYAKVLTRSRVVQADDDAGYLVRALRNTWHSTRRGRARRPFLAAVDVDAIDVADPRAAATEPPAAAAAREVLEAIAALPNAYRESLVAVDIAGLSYGETASALGVREGTVTSRLFRARGRVAEALAPAA
jgi:RNA polymerase sigma-70 factor (ECF subfamily)